MKKKLLLIMAILCLVALLAGLLVACNDKPAPQPEPPTDPSEPAEPGETGGLEFYLKEDGTYMVSNYTGSETDVVIPVKHDNKAVTEIGPSAFAYRSLITSITIPSSVTKIGDQAFYNCLSLTTINYNAAAVEALTALGESVDDLNAVMKAAPLSEHSDGVHYYTPAGTARISEAVTRFLCDALELPFPAGGATAVGASSSDIGT